MFVGVEEDLRAADMKKCFQCKRLQSRSFYDFFIFYNVLSPLLCFDAHDQSCCCIRDIKRFLILQTDVILMRLNARNRCSVGNLWARHDCFSTSSIWASDAFIISLITFEKYICAILFPTKLQFIEYTCSQHVDGTWEIKGPCENERGSEKGLCFTLKKKARHRQCSHFLWTLT